MTFLKNKKRTAILCLLLILVICAAIKNNEPVPENRFGITAKDSFCLSHFYNVNSVVGYQKTEFTDAEMRRVLRFLASLDNEEILETVIDPDDMLYGIPPSLIVSDSDSEMEFFFYTTSKIELEERDKEGNVLSRKQYTTTRGPLKNMLDLLGLPDK